MSKKVVSNVKKKKEYILSAVLKVWSRPNNTILSLCRDNGQVITHVSCGTLGFKNCRKSTPHATQMAIKKILEIARDTYLVKEMKVVIRGTGIGRESILTNLGSYQSIDITEISDVNSAPYGGVRWARRRRV